METPNDYIDGVLSQNRRLLSKTITLVESSRPEHQEMAQVIIDGLLPHTGKAYRVGITGVPGVGKSTFIDSFGMMLLEKGHRIAVLAVDPSSSRSGGSIMADKTRMEKLSVQEKAFIRPSPSGGTLGGVARKTRETMMVCEAAGYDAVIVETVGVGQSETKVSSMVDFFLVLMLAGAGDELQGIKKGVLELADTIAVNKADGDNTEKAAAAARAYEIALHMLNPRSANWTPPVLTCSGREEMGLDEIWETIVRHRDILESTGELEINRRNQAVDWMWSLIHEGLETQFFKIPEVESALPGIRQRVNRGEMSPTAAARELLFFLDNHFSV